MIDCKKAMKTSRNLLVDKLTTAEKYWSMLELEIARCKSEEEVVTLEDLQLAFENAVNSNVENIDVSEPAEYFLAAGRKHTEEVELAMKQLIDVSDAVIERAKELWKIAKTCPLPKELCTRLKRRIDVCTTVNKCSKFLDQSSLPNFHSDERYLASVRELKTTLSNLLHDESTEIEATMLEKVSGPFNLYHWRCEVNGLWIHGSQLATAEKLLEEACKLGDAASSTDEWKVLEKEIKAARENTETALLLVENFNKATATLEDEISIDASNVVQIIEHYLKTWNDSTTELKERLASCLAAEQSIRIKQPDIHHQLVECHEAIRLVESSSSVVLRILGIMAEFGADSSLVQSENALQLSSRHVIDFRDLTTLANNLAEYAVKLPQFKLMGVLHHSINKLHADSYKWNEEAQVLIPPKATRNKSKIETKTTTRTAIVEKLMEPVALAVRLPMHERLLSTLSEIDTFSTELLAFLLSGVAIKASISIQDQFDEKFQNQLYEDIGKLYHMQETINLLPVDLSEAQVLNWLIQLFEWTQYVPYPSDDPAHAGIVLSDAKSKLQSAATVIAQVPSNVLQLLSSLKVLNLDPTVGPQGFVERTHNVIKLSGSLLDFLEKEVDKAEKIQREIEVALEMRAGHNQLLHLSLRMASLLVQPDFAVKKNLDRELKASEIAEANKASGKAPKKPESEGKSSGQRDYSQPLTLSGHKLEVKPRAELTVVPPVNTVKCAAASCDGQVLIGRGAYCSDQCACASASSLFSDLLTARNLITSIAYVEKHYSGSNLNEEILRIAQLLVADKKAFQILRENDESIEEIFSKKLDQKNYIASLNSALTTNKPKDENPTTPSSEKKLPMLMDLLGGLPVAAASVVLRSEAGEMTAVPSTPTLAAAPSDDDVRFKVRLAFEDFFMKMFFKLLGRDYVGVSAILALEMEEELSKKYTTVLMQGRDSRDGAKSRKELNRKEYRQRFMSLIQNLKRSHNEQLVSNFLFVYAMTYRIIESDDTN